MQKRIVNIFIKNKTAENGNILFTSILIMLAMNFLAVALMQTAQKDYQIADFKTIDSSNLYLAESCTNDAVTWLKTNNRPPTSLPYTITKNDLSHLYDANESNDNKAKLSGYSYNCTVNQITVISEEGGTNGQGENVGSNTGYGVSGNLSPDYYYEITSNANGPKNSSKTVITTVAVQY